MTKKEILNSLPERLKVEDYGPEYSEAYNECLDDVIEIINNIKL